MPNPNIQEGANPLHHNAFVDALVQGMVTPITDRDNASAVVPLVLSVDDEAIGKLQHLQFWSELSSQVTEMREAALRRFAAGVDLPQEIVMGLGDSSHWNAAEGQWAPESKTGGHVGFDVVLSGFGGSDLPVRQPTAVARCTAAS